MKKVRYLVGAVGVAPAALGLMAQAAPAAAHTAGTAPAADRAAKPAKSVSLHGRAMTPNSGCEGSVERQKTVGGAHGNWLLVRFWSTPHGSKTCIGTIQITAGGSVYGVSGKVFGKDSQFYCRGGGKPPVEYGCHGSFYTPFNVSAVGDTNSSTLIDPYRVF
jgi:hypothetical protein